MWIVQVWVTELHLFYYYELPSASVHLNTYKINCNKKNSFAILTIQGD